MDDDGALWTHFVPVLHAAIPELRDVVPDTEDSADVDEGARVPGSIWPDLVLRLLDEDGMPVAPGGVEVWPQLLAFMELLLELVDILNGPAPPPDLTEAACTQIAADLDDFVVYGILCDLTQTRRVVQLLLPSMGPRVTQAAKAEIENHGRHRLLSGRTDIDWTPAGTRFTPLDLHPLAVLGR